MFAVRRFENRFMFTVFFSLLSINDNNKRKTLMISIAQVTASMPEIILTPCSRGLLSISRALCVYIARKTKFCKTLHRSAHGTYVYTVCGSCCCTHIQICTKQMCGARIRNTRIHTYRHHNSGLQWKHDEKSQSNNGTHAANRRNERARDSY